MRCTGTALKNSIGHVRAVQLHQPGLLFLEDVMKVKNIGTSVCTVIGDNIMCDVRPGEIVEIEKAFAAPYLAAGIFDEVIASEPVKQEPVREPKRQRNTFETRTLGES